jgi:hypothetical protein
MGQERIQKLGSAAGSHLERARLWVWVKKTRFGWHRYKRVWLKNHIILTQILLSKMFYSPLSLKNTVRRNCEEEDDQNISGAVVGRRAAAPEIFIILFLIFFYINRIIFFSSTRIWI